MSFLRRIFIPMCCWLTISLLVFFTIMVAINDREKTAEIARLKSVVADYEKIMSNWPIGYDALDFDVSVNCDECYKLKAVNVACPACFRGCMLYEFDPEKRVWNRYSHHGTDFETEATELNEKGK